MATKCCRYCRQPLPPHRLGIEFTPRQGRIFDIIACAGEIGVAGHDLAQLAGGSPANIAVHIANINEKLRDHGYHIRGYGGYRLIKWGRANPRIAESAAATSPA